MTHLGSQVSALVDGQLPPDEAERALAHVAACAECAAALTSARAARRALSQARDVPVDPDLTLRLLALGRGTPETPAHTRPAPAGVGSVPLPGTRARPVPDDCLVGDLVRRRRVPALVLTAALAGTGVAFAGLVALGDQPQVVPAADAATALTLLGHVPAGGEGAAGTPGARAGVTSLDTGAATTGTLALLPFPATEVGSSVEVRSTTGAPSEEAVLTWMAEEGWTVPRSLPEGYRVAAVRLSAGDQPVLELDLVGPRGAVVVTQTPGPLAEEAVHGAQRVEVDGRVVHVLSAEPWHAVVQSGGTVVDVVAPGPDETLWDLVAAHPAAGYDDGLHARILRGWDVLAGSWVP